MRRKVFAMMDRYERVKAQNRRFDVMDLAASIFRRLNAHGYLGTPIHELFRDEVQDFTQAELLLDFRWVLLVHHHLLSTSNT